MDYSNKTRHYIIAVLLLMLTANSHAGQLPLEAGWHLKLDPANKGVSEGWYLSTESAHWKPVQVGQSWEEQGYPYDGYAWYRVVFELPGKARGGRVTIHFGAVDEKAKIWLNGRFIKAVAIGWNSAFELDVTDIVRFNSSNHLAVQVHDAGDEHSK